MKIFLLRLIVFRKFTQKVRCLFHPLSRLFLVKVLLRSNQQTAGLEIMEEMALFQEAGYERLYRWGQTQTRSLTSEEIEVSPTLQRAIKALSDRAVLYRYTLDEYANARKSTTVRGFIEALTR